MNPKICLLLVENNPGDIRLIMEMLKETKKVEFDITNSAKLDESLKLLDEKQFEVILLDLGLPDSQGLDTFKKVRSHAPGLPVVILTGLDDESLALQAIKAGSQDYLTKNTMNSELLVRAIQYAIERKQAEEEINRMAKILDIAPNSITIHDFNGNFIYANQKTFVLHGYTRDEFFALPLGKLDTPDTAKLIPDRMKEISEKGEANFQVEHIRKDGSIFPMEVSVQLTKWGDTNAILSIATDITELKKAELAVEERLKEIICLYGISKIIETSGISLEEIFRRIVRLVPASWQYSEIAVCRIIVDEVEYKEPNFKKTDWMQSSEIKVAGKNVGIIEIYYLEKKSDLDEGPFLKEERLVLDAVAERIGSIFERKQVEEALKQSEHNYRMLFDNMSEGIFVLDAETQKVVLSNKAIAKIYGFDSDADTVNINPIDFILPEDKEAVYKIIAEDMFKNDLQQINEFRSLTKDGREIWISAVGVRTNYKGRLAGLISISEITERKQAEEELRFLIAGIKQSSEGIAISDLDGNLRFVNRAFAIMHGFKETDLIGKNLSTFHNPEQIPSVESANRQIQETGEFAGEIWHTRIDGTVFLAAMHSSLLRDEAGTPAGMVATLRDITKRKKMEEELSIAKKRLNIAN